MKLTKENKHLLKVGDTLTSGKDVWTVTAIAKPNPTRHFTYITVRNQYGQPIYYQSISTWYGVEVNFSESRVNADTLETLAQLKKACGYLLEQCDGDFGTYLNENCSEAVAEAFPFNESLDEALSKVINWIDEIEDDL